MEDSTLKNLKCSQDKKPFVLTPQFSKTILVYSLIVPPSTISLAITAPTSQSDAFSQIKSQDKDGLVAIKFGSNEIVIRVEAADSVGVSEYKINIFRPAGWWCYRFI
jgi:hypothetical protein